ncbi:extracellular solute-binding protein [Brachybacterium sp. YJGR34]|uniref:extracellular solute-binding protein n=1 Tax=Brachybacterium sp. YJGR34 TaxID=2059911 RepID=UPI000E0CA115|nr:extracellular solute-binding protein [Brachybacterium sp. YJGR34]
MSRGQSLRRPPDRRTFLRISAGVATLLPLSALAGCSGSDRDPNTLRIAFQQFGSGTLMEQWIQRTAEDYTADFPERTIELVPIVAAENDYFTKNELLMSSPRTSPDLVYEDTFILMSDVGAGYLLPMDDFVAGWEHWDDVAPTSQEAVTAPDGHVYAVPTHTDTRGIWYHKGVFADAGLPEDWAPGSWEDILETARTLQRELGDEVAPLFLFSGMPQGEKASMQGFEMLLYGTEDTLYDRDAEKWIVGSQGFIDSLAFLRTVFEEDLTLSLGQSLDPNIGESIYSSMLPEGRLGMLIDGSWISQNWAEGAAGHWPEWTELMGVAEMPTQNGQAPGTTTLAGGWSWTIPQYATDPEISGSFIEYLLTTENTVQRAIDDNQITVRADVAEVEEYQTYSPTAEFFTSLLPTAHYRPAFAEYPEVSSAIQEAMETVMTMSGTPEQAAASYDRSVIDIVGQENVQEAAS